MNYYCYGFVDNQLVIAFRFNRIEWQKLFYGRWTVVKQLVHCVVYCVYILHRCNKRFNFKKLEKKHLKCGKMKQKWLIKMFPKYAFNPTIILTH